MVDGTLIGTSKVQLPNAGSVPPLKVKLDVPLICDPVPQILLSGNPVATIPDNAAFRSSVKARPWALKPLPILLMVKRIAVVLELPSVLGINALVKVGVGGETVMSALAAATGATSLLLSVLVVFV